MDRSGALGNLAVVFAGGCVGAGLRAALLAMLGNQFWTLALVNVAGAFLLGVVSGAYGGRVTRLRLFLAVGGLGAFTSWSSLAVQGLASPAAALLVLAEATVGVLAAGAGHLLGRRR